MGMFGAGRAFNLSFRPQPFYHPASMRRVPQPMLGNYSETTNITVKNGPQGFWGFMSGLFSGLGLGGGMPMGGMFGYGYGMPMGGPSIFGNPMICNYAGGLSGLGPTTGGLIGGGQSKEAKELSSLQQIYSKYTVSRDSDTGQYILTKGNGDAITGTYQELVNKAKDNTPQGLSNENDNKEISKEDKAKEQNLTKNNDGEYVDSNNNVHIWDDEQKKFVPKPRQ